MKLKDDSVNLTDINWRMFQAAITAERVYQDFGAELVITSANDGKHKTGSLHYSGMALDLRTYHLGGREFQVASELKKALGEGFDVVLEPDHIHLEWDPKP